jgi:adenylate cyclase
MIEQNCAAVRGPTSHRNGRIKEGGSQKHDEFIRMCRLKRYFSPQIAEVVLKSADDDSLWESHRQDITVVVLDLRGFTRFADSSEPEEVMALLRNYHAEMGRLVFKFQATLERFTGDGIMAFFNDPVSCGQHTEKAVRMALEMRERAKELRTGWLKNGYDLDLGIGISAGYATVGNFGFEGRMDYGAVGTVTNLAYRLCDEAKGGQILTNDKTLSRIEGLVLSEALERLQLKGFVRSIVPFNILGFK